MWFCPYRGLLAVGANSSTTDIRKFYVKVSAAGRFASVNCCYVVSIIVYTAAILQCRRTCCIVSAI